MNISFVVMWWKTAQMNEQLLYAFAEAGSSEKRPQMTDRQTKDRQAYTDRHSGR